jgi:outer membrane receptor for ferrienterochelin and colicin
MLAGLVSTALGQSEKAAVTGSINGYARAAQTQEALIGVAIVLEGTAFGTTTDANGFYRLTGIPTQTYNVVASYLGYQSQTKFNVVVNSGNAVSLNFDLEEASQKLGEVVVQASPFVKPLETPNSVQSLSAQEVVSYPGGNNDIAKVVQSLPGVAGSPAGFRNDVIIRGGAPNENVYYLDGVEIPNINHFATQGSAGGPVGMLNVSFIEDVSLVSSGFSARYDNPLSGVLQFRQRTGNPEKRQGNFRLGASEFAATLEGPLIRKNPKTTFIVSARQSYLQLLFKLIDLPFLPTYWDYQYKVTHKPDSRNEISLIGLGSIDRFRLNPPGARKADETPESYLSKLAVLDRLPTYGQWSSTLGVNWKHLTEKGYFNLTLSGNVLDNRATKHEGNDESRPLLLNYQSRESEYRLRFQLNRQAGDWSLSYGANAQYSRYTNASFVRLKPELRDATGNLIQPARAISYQTALTFGRFGLFGQVARTLLNDRLSVSAGLRTDVNSFTQEGMNPLRTLSPRLALSYTLHEQWVLSASAGRYYKIAPYTVLGFRDAAGTLVNQDAAYIGSDHLVGGVEFLPTPSFRATVEGFYKQYRNYPVSSDNGTSLANAGGDFGVLGNEAVTSTGLGRAYGFEVLLQQKFTRNFFGILAYTWYRSEFTGSDGTYRPSAWDYRHLLSFTGGYKFGKGWEIGARFRYLGGAPYTPFDTLASQYNYSLTGSGTLDYTQLNTRRLADVHTLDLRLTRQWNFSKWSLSAYLDVQNVYNRKNPSPPTFTLLRNADNRIATTDGKPYDPAQPENTVPYLITNAGSTLLPTIGLIVEF